MSAPARRVTVTIDELVLHGFDRRDAEGIADAIRAELSATLVGWVPTAGASVAHLDAGSVTVPPAAAPALVGGTVARRITRDLPGAHAKHPPAGEG